MTDTPPAPRAGHKPAQLVARKPHAVLFDVDYTLLQPNEMFLAPGYRLVGSRFGLELDEARWTEAERAAYAAVKERRRRLGPTHDPGVYQAIAEAVITTMGGGDPGTVRACAAAVIDEWQRCENFTLYDDVVPCFARLREAGIKIALVSNTNRDLDEVLSHFALEGWVDAAVASCEVGEMKPSPVIFGAALTALGEQAGDAVMVGDSVEDDVRGALACGLAALLLDRRGRFAHGAGGASAGAASADAGSGDAAASAAAASGRAPGEELPIISSLAELPAAVGLA